MGGSLASETTKLLESVDQMWKMNVQSALATCHLASKFLKKQGLVILTGAYAALQETSGMIGYGISKASTHQIAQSLSAQLTDSSVTTILPVILDTKSNRESMPQADYSSWTSLNEVSEHILKWFLEPSIRPSTGSMIQIVTQNGKTSWNSVHTAY